MRLGSINPINKRDIMSPEWRHDKSHALAELVVQWLLETLGFIESAVEVAKKYPIIMDHEAYRTNCYRTLLADIYFDKDADGVPNFVRIDDSPLGEECMRTLQDLGDAVKQFRNNASVRSSIYFVSRVVKASQALEATTVVNNRRFGLAGTAPCLLPANAENADQIAVFVGFPFPFVVRPADDGTFRIVGTCYVYGMMDGEALERGIRQEMILS